MNLLHSGYSNIVLAANGDSSFADSIPQPLLNILIGLGIIFAAIVFIAGLIYIIKSISNLSNNKPNDTVSGFTGAVNNGSNTAVNTGNDAVVEEELVDDLELVAVITAAIMASMGKEAPADGLVVRSIRKVNKRWQNA
ncbi:OadG family protein [Anaerocolumna sp. AGMB13025]|jgi:glutaconyl-CoA/methylmalonyl-CoA decarboxylase subunit delta|uniref:OadG family protein n=1 Tax=Anaerocolumna sp. AGMB13025 TaxID=3039116 RepID=UPI00241D7E99|nr:OadG family protein [Anaerocolumna sp. AGMB13025]WFR54828.1 OadG family protein [Anaerocolumna sp. AGMB13025]